MPWCPKCRSEYREGFAVCSDCDVDLVKNEPPVPPKEENDEFRDNPETIVFENEVTLETFKEHVEFMYVASMLDELDIPFRVRSKGGLTLKGIYTHAVPIEKTIYVDEKDYERAEEVLESLDAYLLDDNGELEE